VFAIYVWGLLVALAAAGATMMLLWGLRAMGQTRTVERERLYAVGTALTVQEVDLSRPFGERVIRPMVTSVLGLIARLTPSRNIQELQHKLELAGRPPGWSAAQVVGLRVVGALLCAGLALTLTSFGDVALASRLVLALASGGLGFYLPILWLNLRIGQRKKALLRALPDGLDMLNICVGAGMGFDAALSRVGDLWQTPLADEFNRVVTETRLGKSRRQALQDLARRTEVLEIENFVATIVQADQLGVSIAKVLRTQAEQMRITRRQRAEELARQATIKLLFPLVFLIFPAMLAVLLGPAVPQIMNSLGGLGR
jgi:tight adherence protein C